MWEIAFHFPSACRFHSPALLAEALRPRHSAGPDRVGRHRRAGIRGRVNPRYFFFFRTTGAFFETLATLGPTTGTAGASALSMSAIAFHFPSACFL